MKCCINCTDRHPACWSDCERYAEELKVYRDKKAFLNGGKEAYWFNRETNMRLHGAARAQKARKE